MDLDKVVSKLIDLSEKKYSLLEEVLSLTEKQTSVIEVNDIDGLNLLIDRKQERLDIIKQLDDQFEGIVSDLKTLYEISNLDELELECLRMIELKQCIIRIMNILREISKLEAKNKEKILKNKDELENKIYNMANGRRAIQQYGNVSTHTSAYFIDKKVR